MLRILMAAALFAAIFLSFLAAPADSQASCTPLTKSQCGTQFCDFPAVARPSCSFVWPSVGTQIQFLCVTTNTSGTCRACPPGWTASGAFCVECDPLKSCDRQGQPRCDGACVAAKYPTCDAVTRRVTCQSCPVNYTALSQNRRRLTRGGVLDEQDLCEAYFQCDVGYYLGTASDSGSLACSPCEFPEPSPAGLRFLSRGLTFGDRYSCLYAAAPALRSAAGLGEYGDASLRSCPVGRTSQPGLAVLESDCVPCPSPPAFGFFAEEVSQCVPACPAGYDLRGDGCYLSDPASVDCDADGYTLSGGVACAPAPLPWSAPASDPGPGVAVSSSKRAQAWDALDEYGEFRVLSSTKRLATQSNSDFCLLLRSTIEQRGYVQDKPFFTQACGDDEEHVLYLLAAGPKYLYAFLERPFGNTNRYVMWQVQKRDQTPAAGRAGQVWQTYKLPTRVCSAVVAPGEFVYLALCGSTALAYVRQLDLMLTGGDPDIPSLVLLGTQYVIGRRVGLLIGSDEPGHRDGMRDQARFKGPLSIAGTSDPARLLVADFGNCRVAEVVVDAPGSFLTRATTVGTAACFGGEFPLPYPRNIVSVLGGAAALFLTDRGLVQLDARMRRYVLVMPAEDLAAAVAEPRWILADQGGERLTLHNATHQAVLTREQFACPPRSRSRRGAECSLCPDETYSTGTQCVACSNPSCPPGFGFVNCSDAADAFCRPCTESAPYPFRYGPFCEVVPQYPCPPGYFGFSDCFPCASRPLWMLGDGLCQCLNISLAANQTCAVPSPLPERPQWVEALRCTYLDANCTDLGCYLASAQPRQCLQCPAGKFAPDGLECSSCAGFRQPAPARDMCVCRPPSRVSDDGSACVCPAGHAAGGEPGCAPCQAGTVKEADTELPDDFGPFTEGRCSFCLPGEEPAHGSRVHCSPCPLGKYREGAMTLCGDCPDAPSFALDASTSASCRPCSRACAPGESWDPCPVNSTFFACRPCVSASRYRQFVGAGERCEWSCQPGFYEYNGDCFPCTARTCPAGFQLTPCSRLEDAHCRVPCRSDTKPADHSVWLPGCAWECEQGFSRVVKEFPGWQEFACVLPDEMQWSVGH